MSNDESRDDHDRAKQDISRVLSLEQLAQFIRPDNKKVYFVL